MILLLSTVMLIPLKMDTSKRENNFIIKPCKYNFIINPCKYMGLTEEEEWWFDSGGLAPVGGGQESGICDVGFVLM